MQIKILCVGKLKKSYPLESLVEFYTKRIQTPTNIIEVCAKEPSDISDLHNLWIKHAQPGTPLFVLDQNGITLSDQGWSDTLSAERESGTKVVCFVIGGSHGIPKQTKDCAKKIISIGRATWNHHLMRVLLLDIIYRCEKIWENHPYAHT